MDNKLIDRMLDNIVGGGDPAEINSKIVCPDCGKQFDTTEDYIRHSNSHYHALI